MLVFCMPHELHPMTAKVGWHCRGLFRLKASMPVDQRTKQPIGLLNGGASCALAETASSRAANYCVNQEKAYCVGLDLNANHLSPARKGLVIASTKPIHIGKSTQVWEIHIHTQSGRLICISRMTMAVIDRK